MLKGNIMRELIRPATQGVKSNGKKSVRIPYSLIDMERNIREIADVTRTDNPFGDKRRGNVILRKRVAVV
jgi:hypothetical protein